MLNRLFLAHTWSLLVNTVVPRSTINYQVCSYHKRSIHDQTVQMKFRANFCTFASLHDRSRPICKESVPAVLVQR